MAHSPWMIPTQPDKAPRSASLSGKRAKGSPSRAQSSFASLMAREQNGADNKTASGNAQALSEKAQKAQAASSPRAAKSQAARAVQARPQVARLPDPGIPLRGSVLAGRTPNDLLRMQTFNNARGDLQQARAVDGFLQNLGPGATSLDIARGLGAAKTLRTIAASNSGKGFALTSSDFIHTSRTASTRGARRKTAKVEESGIGRLSARFESGGDGIAAIGYDGTGGTSYGKYQIASRVGSMKNFLNFLDTEAPDLARRLRKAGPANTGSRRGGMPNEWRAIAREQPERFEQLQEAFIRKSHYEPALEAISKNTGVNSANLSAAMREVIWSTAVQHGPAGAARIFARADDMSGKAGDPGYERRLISNVYNLRAGQFGSSSAQIRQSVQNRFREEKQLALKMLDGVMIASRA